MKHRTGLFIFILITAALLGRPAAGAGGKTLFEQMDPSVSYSAWRIVKTAEQSMKMRELHAPGKKRMEMSAQGQDVVMIIHTDTGKGWMLMPQMKFYMEASAGDVNQRSGGGFEVLEQTELGKEQVNGYAATKYKAVFRDPQGGKSEGYFWLTEEHGIPIKSDIVQQTSSGEQRIAMELTDLEVGPQEPSLFEVPDSYQAMPGNIGGMLGSLPGGQASDSAGGGYQEQLEQRQAQQAEERQARAETEAQQQGALNELTVDYLADQCWFDREGQIKVYDDGSYLVGTPAGDGYAMSKGGDTIEEFRARYDGLASKSENRFVVQSHGREFAFERRPCVTGTHSVAGSGPASQDEPQSESQGQPQGDQDGDSEQGVLDKAGDKVKKATDKLKEGFGSLFD